VALEQDERRGDQVRPAAPRSGTDVGDSAGADGVAVALVLGVSEGGEDDALLGGHDPSTLAARGDARNRAALDLPWSAVRAERQHHRACSSAPLSHAWSRCGRFDDGRRPLDQLNERRSVVIHEARITISNAAVGRLRVDPVRISAAGGPLLPTLQIPLQLELFQLDSQTLVLERLEASVWTRPQSGQRLRLAAPVVIEGSGGTRGVILSRPRGASPEDLQLAFLLADGGVRTLDEHVRGALGHVIDLELSFEVRIAWRRELLNDPMAPDSLTPFDQRHGLLSVLAPFWETRAEELQIQLSRDQWAHTVAPGLGHEQLRLVALRLPAAGAAGANVVSLYDAASHAYDAGDWRTSAQKCRDLRHLVEQSIRSAPNERVYEAVARRSGVGLDDPRIQFLDKVWSAFADVTNDAHHLDSISRLDAVTAHATLLLTASMVQYVTELLAPP
jgi:hypothetical protein